MLLFSVYVGMPFHFPQLKSRLSCDPNDWYDWKWQVRNSLLGLDDFNRYFQLSEVEKSLFESLQKKFKVQTTPYYASLAHYELESDPIRQILMPQAQELEAGVQAEMDPLGERKPENRKLARIIHRYSDRALFLVTDMCSVYCRFCTRKHFTASESHFINAADYAEGLSYLKSHPGIREVILSGGDPLTLSDGVLARILSDLRSIDSVEIIRIHTRMPVVCPMRITEECARMFKKYKPVYLITHFNHPRELTEDAALALENLVDHGVPVLNQMVLLNGINNHEAVIAALSRRLLYLRVKPYYMFQCDPSQGSDHFRTSIDDSRQIQKNMWGHLSGLAMPNLILDLPLGGGKVGITPDYQTNKEQDYYEYEGWDGVRSRYYNPRAIKKPLDVECYLEEWNRIVCSKSETSDSTKMK